MPTAPERLKQRSDFLKVASARRKAVTPGLVLQSRRRRAPESEMDADLAPRVGFTVSKKVGNAVERNRVKRRLRAIISETLPLYARPGEDYVVIGRRAALARSYPALKRDLVQALERLGATSSTAGPHDDNAAE